MQQLLRGVAQPAAEQDPYVLTVGVLELVYERSHLAAIVGCGTRPVVGGRMGRGGGTDGAATDIVRQRHPQHVAKRRADELHIAPAGRTEVMMRNDPGLAREAAGRDNDIGAGCHGAVEHALQAPG